MIPKFGTNVILVILHGVTYGSAGKTYYIFNIRDRLQMDFFCKFHKNVILSRAVHLFDGEIMCMVKDESKEEIKRGDRGDQSHP